MDTLGILRSDNLGGNLVSSDSEGLLWNGEELSRADQERMFRGEGDNKRMTLRL